MTDCDFNINWSKRMEYLKENEKDIPSEYGVYEIQGHISDGNKFTRRYVGMSDDLKRRFTEHLRSDEPNKKLKEFLAAKKVFFRYATTKTEDIAKDIEKGLYDKYGHTYNDNDHPPSGSGKCLSVKITETNP